MSLQQRVTQEFERRFDALPAFIVRAPGRVNLIGEHTDYNDGFVLPMAIDRAVWIAVRSRGDRRVIGHSLDFDRPVEFSLEGVTKGGAGWGEYLQGVAWALQEAGYALQGWEGVVASDVPVAAGLSSSAALEMATARVFSVTSEFPWNAARMAEIGQRAENEWVGVHCGIMDQMINIFGRANQVLQLDCRSLEYQYFPFKSERIKIVLCDSQVKRELEN